MNDEPKKNDYVALLMMVGHETVMIGNRNSAFGLWIPKADADIGEAEVGETIKVTVDEHRASIHQLKLHSAFLAELAEKESVNEPQPSGD